MDRELSKSFIRKERSKTYIKIGSGILIIILLLVGLKSILQSSVRLETLRTAVAERGPIEATISASGTVVPEYEQIITCPITSRIDSVYKSVGDKIRKGQSILAVNVESIQLAYQQLKDEYALQQNKKTQLRLRLQRQLIDLKAQLEIKNLQISSLQKDLEQQKHLYEIGAGGKNALDKASLDLEIAKRESEQLRKIVENEQASQQADLNELELLLQIQNNKIIDLKRQMQLAEARANMDGVITWINDDIGSSISSGEVIARIADLESFKVECKVSERNAANLNIGLPVKVRINENYLKGDIYKIQPTIENGIITFIVKLNDSKNPLLRSHLRTDISVIIDSKENVVRVKNGPFVNGSGRHDIFVINDDQAVRRTVQIGATNFDYVEVIDNLEPGETVIISNMKEFINKSTIEIE